MGTITRRALLMGVPVMLGTLVLGGCADKKEDPVEEPPQTNAAKQLTVLESSWMNTTLPGAPAPTLRWVVIFKNPNDNLACLKPSLRIVATAADGTVVGSVDKVFEPLAPSETMAFAEEMQCTQVPANLSVEVITPEDEASWSAATPTASNWNTDALTETYEENSHALSYTGWVSNSSPQDELLVLTVVVRNSAGALVDGSCGTLTVPAGEAQQFELILFPAPQEHASAEVFVHRFAV